MEEQNIVEQKESVSLELTAKGTYKWEIKVRETELNSSSLDRLKALNDKLLIDYPNNTTKT